MNAVVKPQMKQVAYWPDGYWDMDIEAAKDADTFGVFGDLTHSIVEVDAELSGADVDLVVQGLVKEQYQVTNVAVDLNDEVIKEMTAIDDKGQGMV